MAASFFHLYKPVGAWRVLAHLKKSWISREILSILLFLLAWCLATLALLAAPAGVREFNLLALVTAVLGVGVLVCMVKVYQLRSVPAWNRNRTNLEFLFSVFLGVILMGTLLPQAVFSSTIAWKIMLLLSFTGAVFLSGGNLKEGYLSLGRLRLGLSLVGLLVSLLLLATLQAPGLIISSLFFILALAQEILGRWIFYARRTPGI
jgi:DMSO reductase anchor subunit